MLSKNKIMLSELHAPYEIPCATAQTLAFIKENAKSNPNNAALKAPRNAGIDVPFAVNQIAGKQIAQQKLPKWASCEEIIYPAHIYLWNNALRKPQRNIRLILHKNYLVR